jgi:Rha family phage regulatory protein
VGQDGKAYFSPRHICEGLGIDWKTQHRKIVADVVLSSTVVEMPTMRPDGSSIPALMLPKEMAPVVTIKDGQVYANSRDVADFFDKRHDNVMADVQGLLKSQDTPSDWFSPLLVHNQQNHQPYWTADMTRDGFTLLVMGYTGPKAMGFKVQYIQQFNAMEATLKAQAPALPQSYKEALLALVASVELRCDDPNAGHSGPVFGQAARRWPLILPASIPLRESEGGDHPF